MRTHKAAVSVPSSACGHQHSVCHLHQQSPWPPDSVEEADRCCTCPPGPHTQSCCCCYVATPQGLWVDSYLCTPQGWTSMPLPADLLSFCDVAMFFFCSLQARGAQGGLSAPASSAPEVHTAQPGLCRHSSVRPHQSGASLACLPPWVQGVRRNVSVWPAGEVSRQEPAQLPSLA